MNKIPWIKSSIKLNWREIWKIKKILKSGDVTNNGKYNQKFESQVSELYPGYEVISCNSGSQALFLTLRALQLTGKVVLPSFTYIATLSAVVENNLDYTFVDVDIDTWTINIQEVEKLLSKDDSYVVVIAVNTFGNSANLAKLQLVCDKYNCKLIIDDAHGFGIKDDPSIDLVRCFSLHATKGFSTIEGGLCLVENKALARKIRQLKDHGLAQDRFESNTGFNGRLDEIRSFIGISNLKKLNHQYERRKQMAEIYLSKLSSLSQKVRFQKNNKNFKRVYTNFAILFDDKNLVEASSGDKFIIYMEKHNIQVRRYFYPVLHKMKNFKGSFDLQVTDNLNDNLYGLPFYYGLSNKEINFICLSIIKYVNNYDS